MIPDTSTNTSTNTNTHNDVLIDSKITHDEEEEVEEGGGGGGGFKSQSIACDQTLRKEELVCDSKNDVSVAAMRLRYKYTTKPTPTPPVTPPLTSSTNPVMPTASLMDPHHKTLDNFLIFHSPYLNDNNDNNDDDINKDLKTCTTYLGEGEVKKDDIVSTVRDGFHGMIDHILLSENFKSIRRLRMPTLDEVQKGSGSDKHGNLPSPIWGSDHLLISCDVSI
eukprot:CAMPEP_0114348884 /NCGR_PEP_ID=MMETSP0101-20121206/15082_1 /TAXON_ID=38822 ORGANISM="Pteridomonas danica, Strain PT" /NCGR_SAMPLE_ID=MMETSP0101 /ASSEMBLY_ACC=CAM_ASM_000211 /LENGTH=221 /DNA_ID=CAMNT_0001487111 /DNA_START=255 /DNA_END=920 /DNA_ORIENTATION=+